ncbi:MAG: nicotinate-nicotinamide nucleotide adenylyltransferase [Terracidiphilus sp.]
MTLPHNDGLALACALDLRAALRVAFFGGSFDPPHLGHLAVARAARAAFGLDAVLFAPVGAQPLKPEGPVASFDDRLAMTRLAIEGEAGFAISLADAPKPARGRSPAPNYSIDTLLGLRTALDPRCTLYCLMGADSFLGLRGWRRAAEIPFLAPLIVASRPGQPLEALNAALPAGLSLERDPESDRTEGGVEVRAFFLVGSDRKRAPFFVLPGLDVPISASEIRGRFRSSATGQPKELASVPAAEQPLLPTAVAEYIGAHGLYR